MRSRQYTEAEWLAMRPIIEQLYIRELRPLSRVMQILDATHNFKASVAMYKRAMRGWGLYKNNRSEGRLSAAAAAAPRKVVKICRLLPQSRLDKSVNTLAYLFTPWIAHADVVWDADSRMCCPPRAAYIYDDFTQSIVASVAAFEREDLSSGGACLRRAFLELEATLMPRSRSIFSLDSLFFALATLNQANIHKASRLLIKHAAALVALRARNYGYCIRYNAQGCAMETSADRAPAKGYEGEHLDHPFPQILNQLQLAAAELDHDDTGITNLVHQTWSTYHRLVSAASARSISSRASQRGFWNQLLWKRSSQVVPDFINSKATNWVVMVQPVLHYLHKLLSHAEKTDNGEMRLLYLAEITTVHSFTYSRGFEETALSLLQMLESKWAVPGTDDTAVIEAWGSSVTFQLSYHYLCKGDLENVEKYISRIFPAKFRTECVLLFKSQAQCWFQERARETDRFSSPACCH